MLARRLPHLCWLRPAGTSDWQIVARGRDLADAVVKLMLALPIAGGDGEGLITLAERTPLDPIAFEDPRPFRYQNGEAVIPREVYRAGPDDDSEGHLLLRAQTGWPTRELLGTGVF